MTAVTPFQGEMSPLGQFMAGETFGDRFAFFRVLRMASHAADAQMPAVAVKTTDRSIMGSAP